MPIPTGGESDRHGAEKTTRLRAWGLAGDNAPTAGYQPAHPLIIDLDATLVTAHSDRGTRRADVQERLRVPPLCAFADHGSSGTGEPLVIMLRPGNAGSNTASDHQQVIAAALDQAGLGPRPGRKVLIRIDEGATHQTVETLVRRRVSYSVGFTLPMDTASLTTEN